MNDLATLFLYHWLSGIATVLFVPFYPAVAGTLWCAFRLLMGKYVPNPLLGLLIFFAYSPIVLIAASIVGESIYYPRSGINWLYMLLGFGVGILVDFVSMAMLIWGLWRRRSATVRGTTFQSH